MHSCFRCLFTSTCNFNAVQNINGPTVTVNSKFKFGSPKTFAPQLHRCDIKVKSRGRIQDFHWGGGGGEHKRLCAHTHITSRKHEVPYGRGPGLTLWPGSSRGVFDALSCYLSLIFKHSDTKWD